MLNDINYYFTSRTANLMIFQIDEFHHELSELQI